MPEFLLFSGLQTSGFVNIERAQFLYQALGMYALAERLQEDEARWADRFSEDAMAMLERFKHGDLARWMSQLEPLPALKDTRLEAQQGAVTLSSPDELDARQKAQLLASLQALKPWRKGPYRVFGIDIDSEWRSDLKWQRIVDKLDLQDKRILDVGCANGYFGWRMLEAGAHSVVGIDPGWLFIIQFLLIAHYAPPLLRKRHTLLPYRLEDLPANLGYFDTVFSMGVLYHRRSVFDHLLELKQCLRPGGELVLETLVISEADGEVLVPADRYAKMRNVWFLPNSKILGDWLRRAGFTDVRLIDECITHPREQRKTDWLDSQSLEHALDPDDSSRTVEGYPAPRRATLLARRP